MSCKIIMKFMVNNKLWSVWINEDSDNQGLDSQGDALYKPEICWSCEAPDILKSLFASHAKLFIIQLHHLYFSGLNCKQSKIKCIWLLACIWNVHRQPLAWNIHDLLLVVNVGWCIMYLVIEGVYVFIVAVVHVLHYRGCVQELEMWIKICWTAKKHVRSYTINIKLHPLYMLQIDLFKIQFYN